MDRFVPRIALAAILATIATGLLVAPTAKAAHADVVEAALAESCGLVRYQTACSIGADANDVYHCALKTPQEAAAIGTTFAQYALAQATPWVQEMKCDAAREVNAVTAWWNAAWLASVRPVYCWTTGPTPTACPTQPTGLLPWAFQTLSACNQSPFDHVCSPTAPPTPPARLPPPPRG